MPYIGNSQVAGTNTNNFKVLDDITSYTETFDGTSASIVDTTNNTIRVPKHRFYQGQRVTYDKGGAGGTGPLTSIFLVGSTYGASPSSGPVQVTAPAGIQAGDLLIIMASCPNTYTPIDTAIPTGFTKIEDSENTVVDHRISYKIAVGNESGVTYSGQTPGPNEGNMNIFVFRGNTAVTSVSVVNTYAWNTSGSGPSSVSVNAGTGDKALSIITTSSRSSNTNTITPTAPATGWTNYDNINGTGNDEVQALSWNYHTRNGNVSANTTFGSDSRATAIACVLTVNGATGPSDIGGLTSGTVYYAVADSHDKIKLATSLANALSNTVINITSVGSGSNHTLNSSFDGVSKKFKLTHSGGINVNLTNASHATVAINNVIQRPNLAGEFTEGFAIEGGNVIVFKTAPTSTDTFWGNTIAEAVSTFDTTVHTVDSFTADGVATNFSLSKEAISVRDIHVTLDGVTQHTTAFSLQGNVLIFSTAPANGTAIQVKHMGFVGATTSGVTGFYGRLGNVALQDGDVLRGDGSLISGIDSGVPGISTTGTSTFNRLNVTGVSTFASTFNYFGPKDSGTNEHGISLIYNAGSGVLTFHDQTGDGFIRSYSELFFLVDADQSTGYIGGGYGLRMTQGLSGTPAGSLIPYTVNQGLPHLGRDTERYGNVFSEQLNISGVSTFSGPVSIAGTAHFNNQSLFFGPVLNNGEISISLVDNGIAATIDHNDTSGLGLFLRSGGDLYLLADHKTSTNSNGDGYGLIIQSGSGNIIPSHDYKPQLGLSNRRFGTFFAEQLNISGISTFNGIHVDDNIVHTGDTNTKIRFPSNDTFSVETAGSERLRITSNQIRIGSQAGTDTTSHAIQLSGAVNSDSILSLYNPTSNQFESVRQGFFFKNSNDNATEFARIESVAMDTTAATVKGELRFYTTDGSAGHLTDKLRITSAGDVVINDTTADGNVHPDTKLHVKGGITFRELTSASENALPAITQWSSSGTGQDLVIGARSSNGAVLFYTGNAGTDGDWGASNNAERLRIDSSGNTTVAGSLSATNYAGLKVEQGYATNSSLSGTFNYDFANGHVQTYMSSTSGNYTPNFRVDSSTTLASKMTTGGNSGVGDVVSATLFVASSSHYCGSSVQVDGTTTNVTTEWVGGSAPSSANGTGYDIYSFTIVKTAVTPAYTVFANAIAAA